MSDMVVAAAVIAKFHKDAMASEAMIVRCHKDAIAVKVVIMKCQKEMRAYPSSARERVLVIQPTLILAQGAMGGMIPLSSLT